MIYGYARVSTKGQAKLSNKEIAEVLGLSVEVVNTLNEENKAVVS